MADQKTTGFAFLKMHGLGNDFVVVDARALHVTISPKVAQAIGDRHFGVGFDQLVVIHPGDNTCDARLAFWNADGSAAQACGNATRCVARLLMQETGLGTVRLATPRGVLTANNAGDGLVSVNMGAPLLRWDQVPLAREVDTLNLPVDGDPVATGMGNPHCTFFVDDLDAIDLQTLGPRIEHHPLFPERTNVQIAQITGQDQIAVRVWERGVGVTLASGSSSCAVAVAAARRGLTGNSVLIELAGGPLSIDWRADGVWMTGPTQHVFSGTLTQSFLDGLT
ncbi:MAG: diaminopimelate epimerase [Rhodobacteraceae bacterium]|nr:diaminopimelate epimerase [Paracoccaceae bacterium]